MKKKKLKFSDVLIYFFLLFCGIICLVPILNTIAISFSDRTSAAMGLVKLWPVNFTLAPIRTCWRKPSSGPPSAYRWNGCSSA